MIEVTEESVGTKSDSVRILKALSVAAELTGTYMSEDGLATLVEDLVGTYPVEAILGAITMARKQVRRGNLTPAEIFNRIDDGRPGPEEAWAEICKPDSETIIWTQEMADARRVIAELRNQGDMIAARMAFKEAYERFVMTARAHRIPVKFQVSLGYDKLGHAPALADAVRRNVLPLAHVEQHHADMLPMVLQQMGVSNHKALEAPDKEGQKLLAQGIQYLARAQTMPKEQDPPGFSEQQKTMARQNLAELAKMLGKHKGTRHG